MIPELNTWQFRMIMKGLKDATELLEAGHPKAAILELKRGLKLLESRAIATKALVQYYALLEECWRALDNATEASRYASLRESTSLRIQQETEKRSV